MTTTTAPRKRGRKPGTPNPNAGRRPGTAPLKRIDLEADAADWLSLIARMIVNRRGPTLQDRVASRLIMFIVGDAFAGLSIDQLADRIALALDAEDAAHAAPLDAGAPA